MNYYIFLILSITCFSQSYSIIFTEQINNNDNFYKINESGEMIQITSHSRKDSSPIVSKDGFRLVFTSERAGWWKIWKMNLKTEETTQLTFSSSAAYSPVFSNDAKKIIYVHSKDGNQEIYSMDLNGKNKMNLTVNKSEDTMPFVASDNRIYYSTQINKIYQAASMKLDGSDKKILTQSKYDLLMVQPSNDLSKFLYYSDSEENYEIYTMTFDSKKIKRLTNNPLMDIRPRWSHDNKMIVFERGNKGNNHHIYLMNSDGSNQTKLTKNNYNYTPSFYPTIK